MAGVYQVTLSGVSANQFCQNVLHYFLEEASSSDPFHWAEGLITQLVTDLLPPWLDMCSNQFSFTSIRAKKVSGSGGPTAIGAFATGSQIGSNAGDIGASSNAVLLEFPVALNGKNVVGKIYLGGFVASDIDDNAPGPTLVTNSAALLSELLSTVTLPGALGDANFCIYHRATELHQICTAGYLAPLLGTQRRRLHPI